MKVRLDGGRAHGHFVETASGAATAVAVTMRRGEPRTPAQVALVWRSFLPWEFYRWDFGPDRDGVPVYRCEAPLDYPNTA